MSAYGEQFATSMSPRIWRGIIKVGVRNLGDAEDQVSCWVSYLDAGLSLDEVSKEIHEYVHAWHLGNPAFPPDMEIMRGYFNAQDKIEVLSYLDEVAAAPQQISANYRSYLVAEQTRQQEALLNRVLRDAAAISSHGRTEGSGKRKRTLRGPKDAVEFLMREAAEIAVADSEPAFISLKAAKIRARELASKPRGKTGLPTLDAALGGGIPAGSILVVVAPAGHRKSTMGAFLTSTIALQGWPVIYMGHDEGTNRAAVRLDQMGVDDDNITMAERSAKLEDAAARVAKTAERLTREATVSEIMRRPRAIGDEENDVYIAMRAKEWKTVKTGLLVVDSIQSVPCRAAEGLPKFDAIERKMEVLRDLAERHSIAIYATSESNRGFYAAKDEKQQSSGLSAGKGSSSIEYKADVMCSMRKGPEGVRLKVEKNRLGPDEPEIFLHFDGRTCTEIGGPPPPDGVADEQVVLEVVAANPTVSSCRLLFDACRIDGRLRNNTRIHEVVNSLILKGRIRGGNRKPFVVVAPPTIEQMIS